MTQTEESGTLKSIPKKGTLERIFLDGMVSAYDAHNDGKRESPGVTYLDFIGTGITEGNIDQITNNLRYGMYESDDDSSLKVDA